MPKNKISEYSSTAADNTDIGGINIAEGMAPSDVNNALREQMSQLKEFLDGSSGDTITTAKIVATTATILSGADVTGTATFNSAVILSSSVTGTTASFSGATTLGGAVVMSSTLNVAGELTPSGGSVFKRIKETVTTSATAATGTVNYDVITQSVLYYTSNASGNWTLNIRGDGSTSLDSIMSTGQAITIAFLVTQGATAYYQTALNVDGSSVTPKWQGGTGPTSGNVSGIDGYVITLIKTGSATFTALASQTQFA